MSAGLSDATFKKTSIEFVEVSAAVNGAEADVSRSTSLTLAVPDDHSGEPVPVLIVAAVRPPGPPFQYW